VDWQKDSGAGGLPVELDREVLAHHLSREERSSVTSSLNSVFRDSHTILQKFMSNIPTLTLMRMAGGMHDSRNLEQVKLHIALSHKKFKNSRIPKKTSWKYTIISAFE
jgi:hypothetical protein